MRNLNVIARNSVDGLYYPGFVTPGSGHVTFFKIKSQNVRFDLIIPIGGAVPWPGLKVGDHALVGIRCKTTEKECYVPGRVMALPRNHWSETKFYTVRLFTGQCVAKPRILIVRIDLSRYWLTLDYIRWIRFGKRILFSDNYMWVHSSFNMVDRDRAPSALKVNRSRTDITTIKRMRLTDNELLKETQRMKKAPKISRHDSNNMTTSRPRSDLKHKVTQNWLEI